MEEMSRPQDSQASTGADLVNPEPSDISSCPGTAPFPGANLETLSSEVP